MDNNTYYAVCSKHDCDYSTPFNARDFHFHALYSRVLKSESDKKPESFFGKTSYEVLPYDSPELQKDLPSDKFCEKCGSSLLFYCPHCKLGLFTIPDAKHCKHCSGKIKPSPYDTLRKGDSILDDESMTTMDGPASPIKK